MPRISLRVAAVGLAGLVALVAAPWPLAAAPPANDHFASRQPLSGQNVQITSTNREATAEVGEPQTTGDAGGSSVWYTWTAGDNDVVRVSLGGSDFNTTLGVYRGTAFSGLQLIAENDDYYAQQSEVVFRAIKNVAYQIKVDGYQGAEGTFLLTLTAVTPPDNDDFDGAVGLVGETFATAGLSTAASTQAGEPDHTPYTGTVWFRWTPATGGRVGIGSRGTRGSVARVAVYTGDAVDALAPVTNLRGDDPVRTDFDAAAGTTYRICVYTLPEENNTYQLFAFSAPTNDHRMDALPLTGTFAVADGSTRLATRETAEPDHTENASGAHSVWFAWTSPAARRAHVDLAGADFDAVAAVYRENLTPLGSTASGEGVTFDAAKDAVYLIAVDGKAASDGTFTVEARLLAPNDDFAFRTGLSGPVASVVGTNFLADVEPGEPDTQYDVARSTVWWTWNAPFTGDFLLSTEGSDFDTVLSVFQGYNVARLVRVAEAHDTGAARHSRLTFRAEAGADYQFRVDGYQGASGSVRLSLQPTAPQVPGQLAAAPTNPAVGERVQFSVGSSVEATYQWDLGDGTAYSTQTSSISHIYGEPGTYDVTVTVVLDQGAPTISSTEVVVSEVRPVSVTSLLAKLDFKTADRDQIVIKGVLPLPPGATLSSAPVHVDVAGAETDIAVDNSGRSPKGDDSLKLSVRPILGAQNAKFVLKRKNGNFAQPLSTAGLVNQDLAQKPVLMRVRFRIDGVVYETTVQAFYSAKLGKAGIAR